VKTKNEKEHNTFVHIHDNTFVFKKHNTVLTSRIQKEAKINIKTRAIFMYFYII